MVDLVKCIQNNKAKKLINFMTKEVSFLVAKNIYFLEMFFFFLLMFGKGNVSDETLEEGLEKCLRMKKENVKMAYISMKPERLKEEVYLASVL